MADDLMDQDTVGCLQSLLLFLGETVAERICVISLLMKGTLKMIENFFCGRKIF